MPSRLVATMTGTSPVDRYTAVPTATTTTAPASHPAHGPQNRPRNRWPGSASRWPSATAPVQARPSQYRRRASLADGSANQPAAGARGEAVSRPGAGHQGDGGEDERDGGHGALLVSRCGGRTRGWGLTCDDGS